MKDFINNHVSQIFSSRKEIEISLFTIKTILDAILV